MILQILALDENISTRNINLIKKEVKIYQKKQKMEMQDKVITEHFNLL